MRRHKLNFTKDYQLLKLSTSNNSRKHVTLKRDQVYLKTTKSGITLYQKVYISQGKLESGFLKVSRFVVILMYDPEFPPLQAVIWLKQKRLALKL